MSQTIEERLQALEAAFAEIKQAKGIRGPAGPIDAAVKNAEAAAHKVVAGAEARVTNTAEAVHTKLMEKAASLQEVADQLRADVADLKKHLADRITNEVDANLVQTLKDYHLLDANAAPTFWSK
jgi:hypothetical protein